MLVNACQETTTKAFVRYTFNPIFVIPIAVIGLITVIVGIVVCIFVAAHKKKKQVVYISDDLENQNNENDDTYTAVVVGASST